MPVQVVQQDNDGFRCIFRTVRGKDTVEHRDARVAGCVPRMAQTLEATPPEDTRFGYRSEAIGRNFRTLRPIRLQRPYDPLVV